MPTLISGKEKARIYSNSVMLPSQKKKNGYQSRVTQALMRRWNHDLTLPGPHVLCPRTPGELADGTYEAGVPNLQGNKKKVLADRKHPKVSKCKKHLALSKLVSLVSTIRENSGLDYKADRL